MPGIFSCPSVVVVFEVPSQAAACDTHTFRKTEKDASYGFSNIFQEVSFPKV